MSSHSLMNKEILAEVCPQLKKFRLERNLSLEELQVATHISSRLLRRMEDGKCLTFGYLRKLLKLYGIKMRIVLE